jgi:hypothetical protein
LVADKLIWLPEAGVGYYPVAQQPYDYEYWQRYRRMDKTYMAQQLTRARIDLVRRHWRSRVVDIGIGGGRFLEEYPHHAMGYDVNPHARAHLTLTARWQDAYAAQFEAGTFWDSLEHIADPTQLLANVTQWIFVSIPIFKNVTAVIESKHYRKDEHFWYFTHNGFVRFMEVQGFTMREQNDAEVKCGRESIASYAFQRVQPAGQGGGQMPLKGLVTELSAVVDGPEIGCTAAG